jgi:hypothetical protein
MTIVGEESALDELTHIWLTAGSVERGEITAAAAQIEHLLRFNANSQGESRPGGRRVLYSPPLGVTFRVKDDTHIVYVLRVWNIRRHRKHR